MAESGTLLRCYTGNGIEGSNPSRSAISLNPLRALVEGSAMAEKFGGYLLLERIGVGGMAEVFLARHSGLAGFEKEIVIKRIRPHLSEVPSFVNMFLGEAKLAAQLTHPHIVQIYDLGKIKDSYFIAMEHVPGRDLSVIIPKLSRLGIPFPVEYALKVGSNVCEALTYAHTKSNGYGKSLNTNFHQPYISSRVTFKFMGMALFLKSMLQTVVLNLVNG